MTKMCRYNKTSNLIIEMIPEEIKKDIEDFNDFRQETIEQTYDKVAEKYDDIMTSMGHPDPKHCA